MADAFGRGSDVNTTHPAAAPTTLSQGRPRAGQCAEYPWWGSGCPLEVLADTLRGRPDKRAQLVFLAGVYVRHRPRCTATRL